MTPHTAKIAAERVLVDHGVTWTQARLALQHEASTAILQAQGARNIANKQAFLDELKPKIEVNEVKTEKAKVTTPEKVAPVLGVVQGPAIMVQNTDGFLSIVEDPVGTFTVNLKPQAAGVRRVLGPDATGAWVLYPEYTCS